MAKDFERYKWRHRAAIDRVTEELDVMLPTQLEDLGKFLEKCRLNHFNYDILKGKPNDSRNFSK